MFNSAAKSQAQQNLLSDVRGVCDPADCAPSTRDARIRRLRSVFSFAIRKGWATVNVADRLDIVGKRHDEVRIYHAEEVLDKLGVGLAQTCSRSPHNDKILDWKNSSRTQ